MEYGSARDLPSMQEMGQQLLLFKMLQWTPLVAKSDVADLRRQFEHIVGTVDAFYGKLGGRHWVFHDALDVDRMAGIVVDRMAGIVADLNDADAAEAALVAYYQEPDTLKHMRHGLYSLQPMAARRELIEAALDDYRSGRYYATVLVLLSVMDGFVNDIDSARRGLHARNAADMSAWDSVVGHHMGLSNAHRSFTKTISVTRTEPVYELHRNGIVHGTLTNYSNPIVATKAWNRLFAVADWARAKDRQAAPKPEPMNWWELLAQVDRNSKLKAAVAAWTPSTHVGESMREQEVSGVVSDYCAAWSERNFGRLAEFLPRQMQRHSGGRAPREMRNAYDGYYLTGWQVVEVEYVAAAVAQTTVALVVNDVPAQGNLRWIRENDDADPVPPSMPGDWRLYQWGPPSFLAVPPRSRPA